MKKNLIVALALVFVLGIAGTAFAAANPFVDVPAKHWAYDAVSKLAKAGILDGYGDGTYRGERLASRYEMAQATAKAMARADKADAQMKALIDKLAVEFAAELNNLGVRVAKLEKNASSIKFNGDSRLRWRSNAAGAADTAGSFAATAWNQRIRVYAQADVNEKTKFYGRLMAEFTDGTNRSTNYMNAGAASSKVDTYWDYGYFEWTFNPGFKVAVGRQQVIAGQNLFWTNGGYDSIQFKYASSDNRFNAKLGYGDVGTYDAGNTFTTNAGGTDVTGQSFTVMAKPLLVLDANYKFSKAWAGNFALYYSADADADALTLNPMGATTNLWGAYTHGYPFQVYNFGLTGQLNDDFKLIANYFWNNAKAVKDETKNANNTDARGWMAAISYKGAQAAKVGSWGMLVSYRDIKPWAIDFGNVSGLLGNSMTATSSNHWGQKGWGIQADYTISKNAVLTATYENLNRNRNTPGESTGDLKLHPFYYLQLNVSF